MIARTLIGDINSRIKIHIIFSINTNAKPSTNIMSWPRNSSIVALSVDSSRSYARDRTHMRSCIHVRNKFSIRVSIRTINRSLSLRMFTYIGINVNWCTCASTISSRHIGSIRCRNN